MQLKAHKVGDTAGLVIQPAHPQREWMSQMPLPTRGTEKSKGKGFANRCLPMLMSNQIGWEVRTTADYAITTLPDGSHAALTLGPVVAGAPRNNFSHNIVTWAMPWVFETPEDWDLLILPPLNHVLPEGVTCLSGLVETDHAHQTFTLNWMLRPLKGIYIPSGTAIATLVPFPTAAYTSWELVEDDVIPQRFDEFINRRDESINREHPEFGRWDKDYWNEAKRRKIGK